MPLTINLHPGGARLETAPASDASIELHLGAEEAEMIGHLLAADSWLISKALGAVFLAGVREGHRNTRRVGQPGNS